MEKIKMAMVETSLRKGGHQITVVGGEKIKQAVKMIKPVHIADYVNRTIILLKIVGINAKNVQGILIISKIAEIGKIIMKLSFLKNMTRLKMYFILI